MELPSPVSSPGKLYPASLSQVTKKREIFTVSCPLTHLGILNTPASSGLTWLPWKSWHHAVGSPSSSDPPCSLRLLKNAFLPTAFPYPSATLWGTVIPAIDFFSPAGSVPRLGTKGSL